MVAYEKNLHARKPDKYVVAGDVNSSMACASTAKKNYMRDAHIEAGLHSYEWKMPEEINRLLIDSISDYFFTKSEKASYILL